MTGPEGMVSTKREDGDSHLCYLDASQVQSPAGELSTLDLQSVNGEPLGNLQGVLIDPGARRLRYFVVESPGWFRRRRYLVSADRPACVESGLGALRLDVAARDLARCEEFDAGAVREFSEEDAVTAMFAQRVA